MNQPKKRILIIDDDEDILDLIKVTLKLNNFECATALSAPEGLEKAKKVKPHLILLDLLLPQVSGIEFLQELKNDPELAGIPVVALTSLIDEETAQKVMNSGAVGYLSKACNAKELLSMVKEYAGG
jgi:DNA-binding response OmpR family regulator